MYFTEEDDLIDIRKDNVFKAVFTKKTPESMGALTALISTLINRNISIAAITANEPAIDNINDRQIRYDITCITNSGEIVNVEMALHPLPHEPVKLEFYASKLFIGQDIRGTDKSYDDLKESYQIAILAEDKFFADESVFHAFEYYDSDHNISLNGRSRIITIELSKVNKITDLPPEKMSKAEQWAYYFEHLTDPRKREKINKIIECQEGIAMASVVLNTISKDWEERCRLTSEEKYQLDLQSRLTLAKREGKRQADEEWQPIVADKDAKLADKDAKLADKDAKLADKDAKLADKDAKLADKDAKLADKDAKLADKDAVIADKDAEIARLRTELENR